MYTYSHPADTATTIANFPLTKLRYTPSEYHPAPLAVNLKRYQVVDGQFDDAD